MCGRVRIAETDSGAGMSHSFCEPSLAGKDSREVNMRVCKAGVHAERLLQLLDVALERAEVGPHLCIRGTQAHGVIEMRYRVVALPCLHKQVTKSIFRFGKLRLKPKSFEELLLCISRIPACL